MSIWDIDDVRATKETDAALFIESDETGKVWIPKSQISSNSEVLHEGDEGTLCVTGWLAEERGWK